MKNDKLKKVESLLTEAKENLNEAVSSEEELEEFERREAYLQEFNRVCERFGVEIELEEDGMDKDEVYSDWSDEVNISATELKKWSKNPCSREASKKPVTVIKRNLRLLERDKDEWTENDYKDAKRTISFISRMRGMRPDSPREGPFGCPSEWAISLLNWAYNPFDSVPTPGSETKDKLDSVEEVTLSSELEERRNIKEAETLAEQVWVMKDVMQEFEEEFEAIAMSLENENDLKEVKRMREQTLSAVELLSSKLKSPVKTVKNNRVEEMSDSRQASQVFHSDQERNSSESGDEDRESVEVPPVAIHKVEGGNAEVEVSEDVEKVLNELWDSDEE